MRPRDAWGVPDQERDAAEQAREICLRLLEAGPRTTKELATKLRAAKIPDEVAEEVIKVAGL